MARKATKAEFRKMAPQVTDPAGKAKTWITRGGNFAVAVSEVEPGAILERANDPEEHMIIVPPSGPTLSIAAGGKTIEAKAELAHHRAARREQDHRADEGPVRADLLQGVAGHHGAGVERRDLCGRRAGARTAGSVARAP